MSVINILCHGNLHQHGYYFICCYQIIVVLRVYILEDQRKGGFELRMRGMIEPSEEAKYLRVIFDRKLSFRHHI
jgi:hypothetical protein